MFRRGLDFLQRLQSRVQRHVMIAQKWPLILIALLYTTARLSGGTLPFLIFRIFFLLWVGTYIWTVMANRNVSCIYASDRTTLTRGQEATLSLRFENEGFTPVAKLEAWCQVPGQVQPWHLITSVPGLKSRILTVQQPLNEHGNYRLGPVTYEVSDPFGWFTLRRMVFGDRFVTVFPRILPVSIDHLPLRRPFGNVRTRLKAFADPSNLADIRVMNPGDNPKHIHWPTSARMGDLFVREFELTATGEVNIILDLAEDGVYDTPEAKETAFDLAAGLASDALHRNLAVGLVARCREKDYSLKVAKGSQQMGAIMRSLAYSTADCPAPLEHILRRVGHSVASGSTLLVVTGRLTAELSMLLSSFIQAGLGVAVFLSQHQRSTGASHQSVTFPVWSVAASALDLNSSRGESRLRSTGGRPKREEALTRAQ